jgi:hypothetical protein
MGQILVILSALCVVFWVDQARLLIHLISGEDAL